MIDPEVQAAIDAAVSAEAATRATNDRIEHDIRALADAVEVQNRIQGDADTLAQMKLMVIGNVENFDSVYSTVVQYGNSIADPVMPYAGKVVALSCSLSAPLTAGGVAVYTKADGIRFTDDYLLVGGPNAQYGSKVLTSNMTFQAGQRVGFDVVSVFAQPAATNATLVMVVEFN